MRWVKLAAIIGCAAMVGCGKPDVAAPSVNDTTEFFNAVQDGDAEIVRRLVQAKPGLVNARNEQGQTALQVANQRGSEDLADVLKKAGAKE